MPSNRDILQQRQAVRRSAVTTKRQELQSSKAHVTYRVHAIPEIGCEDQRLTSAAGLVLFKVLFQRLGLKTRPRSCFSRLVSWPVYDHAELFLLLVAYIVLGYRSLRDVACRREDTLALRVLRLRPLPDVATLSRCLRELDSEATARIVG